MRILIASDDEQVARRIRESLRLQGLSCPAGHVVPLEAAADRSSRLIPELLVIVLSTDPAAGLAALRETCNTIQSAHTLAVGPMTDAQLIIRTLHEGADQYLDEAQVETQLSDALARLKDKRSSQPKRQKSGKVIAVLSPSGGCGSSTLAANVSTVLAQQHEECGLVDLRLAAGDLAAMLDLKPTHTVADLCRNLGRVDRSMFEQFFVRHRSGVHLLAAPDEYDHVKSVDGKGVRRMLAMARVRFPYVVVDLDNALSAEQVEAIWQSDVVLLVVRLDYTSLRNARRTTEALSKLGIGLERVQVVVNGYGQPRQLSARQAEEALGIKPAHYIPNDPASINRAINQGTPVVLQRPHAKISRRIRSLAMSVNGREMPDEPS